MRRRTTCSWLAQPLLVALVVGLWSGTGWSQAKVETKPAEPAAATPAETPAAATAAAPAAPAPAPDPAQSPTEPDSTGANYTGANTYSPLTKDADGKVTQATLAQDVKAVKLGLNIFWTLLTGFIVMFMQ